MRIQQIKVLFWLIALTAVLMGAACGPGETTGPKPEEPTKAAEVTPTPIVLVECAGSTDEEILTEITGAIDKELVAGDDKLTLGYSANTLTIKGELAGRENFHKVFEIALRYRCVKKINVDGLMFTKCPGQEECSNGTCDDTCDGEPKEESNTNTGNQAPNTNGMN